MSCTKSRSLIGESELNFGELKVMQHYLSDIAAHYVRGSLGLDGEDEWLIEQGRAQGLRMYRFKRSELPRVSKCIGILKGLSPSSLLDVGSGRGAFLWTLLSELPDVEVTCVDVLSHRVELINTVRRGGLTRVGAMECDVQQMPFKDKSFDVACALEVLEHLLEPAKAVRELSRITRDWLLVSVPSKPDDNPEHVQLFSSSDLDALLLENGAVSVQSYSVLNHRIALAKLS